MVTLGLWAVPVIWSTVWYFLSDDARDAVENYVVAGFYRSLLSIDRTIGAIATLLMVLVGIAGAYAVALSLVLFWGNKTAMLVTFACGIAVAILVTLALATLRFGVEFAARQMKQIGAKIANNFPLTTSLPDSWDLTKTSGKLETIVAGGGNILHTLVFNPIYTTFVGVPMHLAGGLIYVVGDVADEGGKALKRLQAIVDFVGLASAVAGILIFVDIQLELNIVNDYRIDITLALLGAIAFFNWRLKQNHE